MKPWWAFALVLSLAQAQQVFNIEGQVIYSANFPLGRWEGRNASVKGVVNWDKVSGFVSGDVCIQLARFDSGIGLRDDDAREVLEVNKFPQACLDVSRLTWNEASKAAVLEGVLEFRNQKKPLKVSGQLVQEGNGFRFSGSFRTGFKEWGMPQPQRLFLVVDDPIDIRLEAKAVPNR